MKKGFVLFPVFQIDGHFTFYYFSFACPFYTIFHASLLFIFISALFLFYFLLFFYFPHLSICFLVFLPFQFFFSFSLSVFLWFFSFFSCPSSYLLYSHYICPGHRGQMVTKAFHVNEKISYWLVPQMGKRGRGPGVMSPLFCIASQ